MKSFFLFFFNLFLGAMKAWCLDGRFNWLHESAWGLEHDASKQNLDGGSL